MDKPRKTEYTILPWNDQPSIQGIVVCKVVVVYFSRRSGEKPSNLKALIDVKLKEASIYGA